MNPFKITYALNRANYTTSVYKILRDNSPNAINFAAAFSCLGKLKRVGDEEDWRWLCRSTKRVLDELDFRNLAMSIFCTLGILNRKEERLIHSLSKRLIRKMSQGECDLYQVVRGVLNPCKLLELENSKLVDSALNCVRTREWKALDARDLIAVLSFLKERHLGEDDLYGAIFEELKTRNQFTEIDLAELFRLNSTDLRFSQTVAERLKACSLQSLSFSQLIFSILKPIAKGQMEASELRSHVFSEIKTRLLTQAKTRDLYKLLCLVELNDFKGFSRLVEEITDELLIRDDCPSKWIIAAIITNDAICSRFPKMVEAAESIVRKRGYIWTSFDYLSFLRNPGFHSRVREHFTEDRLHSLSSEFLHKRFLSSCYKARFRDDFIFIKLFEVLKMRGIDKLSNQELVRNLLDVFSELGFYETTVFAAIFAECRARGASQFTCRELAQIIRAHAIFGLPYPEEWVVPLQARWREWDRGVDQSLTLSLLFYKPTHIPVRYDVGPVRSSGYQKRVAERLKNCRLEVSEEVVIENLSADLLVVGHRGVFVNVDGPIHYSSTGEPLGRTLLRDRLFKVYGYPYVVIKYSKEGKGIEEVIRISCL